MDNIKDQHLSNYTFEKIDKIDNIYVYYGNRRYNDIFEITIFLTLENNDIIGEFGIEGKGLYNQFDSGNTNSMSISIHDDHQGNGYSKLMIKYMIDKMYEDIPNMNDKGENMLFIDADASNGFWDKVGMVESYRYGYNRNPKYSNREGAGYEKYITINKLNKFANY
jgi:GNAT superfamily N-acetyltransferase